jgi:hypothetical protein
VSIRTLTAATLLVVALGVRHPEGRVELADADSLSPATAVTATLAPTLSVAPSFAVGRLCLPGSTCP